MSLLPASMKKIRSKMKALEWTIVPSGAILFAAVNFTDKWNKSEKILLMPLKMKVD